MMRWEQRKIIESDAIGLQGLEGPQDVTVILCKPEMAWTFQSGADFATMTVTPSLDASAAGHWHGHVTSGEIVGGIA